MDGKTPKSKLTKRDAQIVNSVAKSGAEMVEVGDGGYMGKTKCVVIPNLTQDLIDSKAFHFVEPTTKVNFHMSYLWGGNRSRYMIPVFQKRCKYIRYSHLRAVPIRQDCRTLELN